MTINKLYMNYKNPQDLPRSARILSHPEFQKAIKKLEEYEKDRIYCRHNMPHLLDVSRIGWIMILEQGLPVSKDIMYAAGLLHDIGKGIQYENGTPHNVSSAQLARPILQDCGFNPDETDLICKAILNHRRPCREPEALIQVLYAADKASRACYACHACRDCDWSDQKKNLTITL